MGTMGAVVRKMVRSPYFWLAVIGLLLFSITFFSGFVDDDLAQVVNQNHVHNLHGLIWSFRIGEGLFRPLMFSYFTLCYALFGLHAWGYHLFEVAFGLANVLLVYWVLRQFFSQNLAFWLAVVFLVSPLNVDAVSYVSHIQDVLFLFFGLLCLRVVKSGVRNWLKTLLVIVLLLASLLSKETGALFLPMIIIFTWWFTQRGQKAIYAGAGLAIVIYVFLREIAPNDHSILPPFAPVSHFGLGMRLLQIPSIIWFYLSNFIFPRHLSISRLNVATDVSLVHFWLPLIAELIILGFIIWLGFFIYRGHKKHWRTFCFFFIWLALGLGFHSQIKPIFDATYSNWWFYFPMVGLLGLAGVAITAFWPRGYDWKHQPWLVGFLVIWLLFLLSQNVYRQLNFHSEKNLVTHDISVNSNSYLLQNEYGSLLISEGRYAEAQIPLYKSISLLTDRNSAWDDLGVAYYSQGNAIEARDYFKKAVEYYPDDVEGYYNYASSLINSFQPDGIKDFLSMAIKRFPDDVFLWQLRAAAYDLYGDSVESARAQTKAYQLAREQHVQLSVEHRPGEPFNIKLQTQ